MPDGLIGLYEEAFEEHLPVLQRQQLLQRFALFALLKKEVSAIFVAEVLEESEQEISDFTLSIFNNNYMQEVALRMLIYHFRFI